ncbi:MAG: type VI secretion system tip protein VgrG [Deltaproteobacteria bacterium]|nr:type VI secretion system tip protein VgrG [Deltaproteobacteria bacterium]
MSTNDSILTVELESTELASRGVELAEMPVFAIAGEDALSRLFEIKASVVYRDPNAEPFDVAAFLEAEIAVVFRRDGVEVRRIHGLVREVRDRMNPTDMQPYVVYDFVIVPRLWHLDCVVSFDVFLDKTVPEILQAKLENLGFSEGIDFEFRLLGSYPKREFVMQFRESDLAFVMRLVEHVGIAFYFDHASGADKLVFTDDSTAFRSVSGSPLPFNLTGKTTDVYALERSVTHMPEIAYCIDYDYRQPSLELSVSHQVSATPAGGVIDYGSNFTTIAEGEALVRARVEERQVATDLYLGTADTQTLFAGGLVAIHGHTRHVPTLLVTRVVFEGRQPAKGASTESEPGHFAVRFEAIPATRQFRPARVTPKPRIFGVLPAVIETDDIGTIEATPLIDSFGRYRVHFKFDAEASSARHGSHWVRLAQPLSGPGYGWSFPIRRGVEVMVAFEDGDPDRPVIVGAVYNGHAPNPVTATNSLKSRLVSQSGVLFEIDDGVAASAHEE